MAVNERVGVDETLQSMNFLQRMAHSHSFCLSRDRETRHSLQRCLSGDREHRVHVTGSPRVIPLAAHNETVTSLCPG